MKAKRRIQAGVSQSKQGAGVNDSQLTACLDTAQLAPTYIRFASLTLCVFCVCASRVVRLRDVAATHLGSGSFMVRP